MDEIFKLTKPPKNNKLPIGSGTGHRKDLTEKVPYSRCR